MISFLLTQGLFSRITFREPVFLGGIGNITGLAKRLPVSDGITGCIRKFIANEHEYNFALGPSGDITQGFDIRKYTTLTHLKRLYFYSRLFLLVHSGNQKILTEMLTKMWLKKLNSIR